MLKSVLTSRAKPTTRRSVLLDLAWPLRASSEVVRLSMKVSKFVQSKHKQRTSIPKSSTSCRLSCISILRMADSSTAFMASQKRWERSCLAERGSQRCRGVFLYHWAMRALLLGRSEEHTSELQSRLHLVCRLLLEKKKKQYT